MNACNCRERIEEKLAKHNTKFERFYILDSLFIGTPYAIRTTQIEKGRGKKQATSMFASFCPFCGVSMKKPVKEPT